MSRQRARWKNKFPSREEERIHLRENRAAMNATGPVKVLSKVDRGEWKRIESTYNNNLPNLIRKRPWL